MIKQVIWWPVAICWIYTYIDDSRLPLTLLDNAVAMSTLDPYAGTWIALNVALAYCHDKGIAFERPFWVGATAWTFIGVWEMVMQAYMLPKVFEWIEADPAMNLMS